VSNTMLWWNAAYSDGTSLPQYDGQGRENRYIDIERSKLVRFDVLLGEKVLVAIHLGPHQKLICRWRHEAPMAGTLVPRRSVLFAGWHENRDGVNVGVVLVIFPDGHIEVVDRFREGHPWLYPIILMDCEK